MKQIECRSVSYQGIEGGMDFVKTEYGEEAGKESGTKSQVQYAY